MSNWYCVRTNRFKESWVTQQLTEIGLQAYLPLLREQRKVRRQLKWVVEPLFPSYLFAYFALAEAFYVVRHMPGVAGVVGTLKDGPVAVDEQIISILHDRSQGGYIEIGPYLFSPGEELQVVQGPFLGLRALFQQELNAGERVVVLLELLSSQVRAELPRTYVGKSSTARYWRSAV
jgi:transcriptional antiterminator RfaH